jgi:hypothetical protein
MDYLVFSVLLAFMVTMINISYDIACQWHKKLWTHMEAMPSRLHIPCHSMTIQFFVPKFHLKVHIDECQRNFSFNWSKHVGQTDGEAPECGWSNINWVTMSMKEMGPGSCRDTLDNHFRDWNWKKVTALGMYCFSGGISCTYSGIGHTLLHKISDAIKWKKEHGKGLAELERTIQPMLILQWRKEVEAWEEDSSQPNLFESCYAHE